MPDLVVLVGEVQVSIRPLLRHDHHADDATGATIPLDSLPQGALDEVHSIFLLHAFLPVCVTVTVDVRRAGTADRVGLLV